MGPAIGAHAIGYTASMGMAYGTAAIFGGVNKENWDDIWLDSTISYIGGAIQGNINAKMKQQAGMGGSPRIGGAVGSAGDNAGYAARGSHFSHSAPVASGSAAPAPNTAALVVPNSVPDSVPNAKHPTRSISSVPPKPTNEPTPSTQNVVPVPEAPWDTVEELEKDIAIINAEIERKEEQIAVYQNNIDAAQKRLDAQVAFLNTPEYHGFGAPHTEWHYYGKLVYSEKKFIEYENIIEENTLFKQAAEAELQELYRDRAHYSRRRDAVGGQ